MRFVAPRSASTSPERGRFRGSSSYGLYSESESESDAYERIDGEVDSDTDDSAESSGSSHSRLRLSELRTNRLEQKSPGRTRTSAEMRYIEDTIAAIRLRTRHQDPYEKWEQETRKDAFRKAKKALSESQTQWHDQRDKARAADLERLSTLHTQQMAEVQSHLNILRQQQQSEEQKLREGWKARDRLLWQRIESVINMEEEKARKKLEEERRIRQEAEMRRRQEEERRRAEEERKRQEEERKRKEEEEARRQKEEKESKKAEEKRRQEEEDRNRLERQKTEQEQRNLLGLSTVDEDWYNCRSMLHRLKNDVMKVVKGNKEMKKQWGDVRRQITPKIGQLTNDDQSITRISKQLIEICKPPNAPAHSPILQQAILSSLAKAILMQAETEVTAEVRTAEPLAKVALNLLIRLEHFPEIFYVRLVQRVGGWVVPVIVPKADIDGRIWKDVGEKLKVMGYRKGAGGEDMETNAEYCSRIAGIMRVYFHILRIPPPEASWLMFQTPRYWSWFSRMTGGQYRALLGNPAAAYLIHTALDVMGADARNIWGIQWVKILALVYGGVTEGIANGIDGEIFFIGGQSPEGKSARMRVQLAVERIMTGVNLTAVNTRPLTFS